MGKLDTLLSLFKSFFVTMQLRKYSTKLKAQFRFQLDLKDSHCHRLLLYDSIVSTKMIKCCLEAKSTLFKLALLLVAHGHIMKQLQSYELVSFASREVNRIQNTMRFLKQ